MQRAEHLVAGDRRVRRHLGGLEVADLADHDHVRVGAHQRAQRLREREADGGLTSVWTMPSILRSIGILDGVHLALRRLDELERGVQRGGLAGARRADDDDAALRGGQRLSRTAPGCRPEAERGERGRQRRDLEDAQRDVLAVQAGDGGQAQVDGLAAGQLERGAPVLRQPPLGDVHVAHDLEAARDAGLQLLGELAQVVQHAVDAAAHVQRVLARLEVDVRGVHAGGVGEEGVDHLDDVGVDGAPVSPPPHPPRGVLELAARAEVDGDRLVETALRADDGHHAPLGAHADLVDGDDVQRVGHRQVQCAVAVDAQRHEPVAHDEIARQQAHGGRLRGRQRQIGDADAHLAGDRGDDVLFGDEPLRTRTSPRRPPSWSWSSRA